MKTILVPVDGSRNALRALDLAIDLAKALRGRIHVVNVQPPPEHYGMVLAYLDKKQYRQFRRQDADEILRPAVRRLEKSRVSHDAHVVFGEIGPAIVRAARSSQCDGIVMGTGGLGAIGKLLLGSVATKVIHRSKVPVMLVK